MRRHLALFPIGIVLIAAGVARLVMPFSSSVGTVSTNCGNVIAYLGGLDTSLTQTVAICTHALKDASYEGVGAVVVGLALFVWGIVSWRRYRRLSRSYRHSRRASGEEYRDRDHERDRDRDRDHERDRDDYRSAPRRTPSTAGAVGGAISDPDVFEEFMRLGRLTRPRTVLSFFGVLFAALVAGSVIAISLFLQHQSLTHYVPWILAFDALIAVVLIIGVFVTITKDPARLMLSEIANQNAVAIQRTSTPRRTATVVEQRTPERAPAEAEPRSGQSRGRRWDDPQP